MPSTSPGSWFSFVGVVVLWASTPVVVNTLYDENNLIVILAWATVFSSGALTAAAVLTGRFRESLSFSARDWATIAGMGLLGIAGYLAFFYSALVLAPADKAMVVNYLWPVFLVLLAGWLLRERHDAWTYVGIALSFAGAAGVITGWGIVAGWEFESPTPRHLAGYGCAVAGALCWALFSVLGKRLRYGKLTAMALYCIVGAVVFLAVLLLYDGPKLPAPGGWGQLIYLGALVNGVAYVLWFKAIAGGPTALFANLIFATPFVALFFLWVSGRAESRPGVWISLALIVTGALIAINRAGNPRRSSPRNPKPET